MLPSLIRNKEDSHLLVVWTIFLENPELNTKHTISLQLGNKKSGVLRFDSHRGQRNFLWIVWSTFSYWGNAQYEINGVTPALECTLQSLFFDYSAVLISAGLYHVTKLHLNTFSFQDPKNLVSGDVTHLCDTMWVPQDHTYLDNNNNLQCKISLNALSVTNSPSHNPCW